jgi:hypothetical protein
VVVWGWQAPAPSQVVGLIFVLPPVQPADTPQVVMLSG